MEIRFHGHACFEIIGSKGRILIDPFITGNPMAVVDKDYFTELDAILVSHGHADHLGDAIEISKKTNAPIIGVHELAKLCQKRGASTHAMHIGGKHQFDFGIVRLTQALHGSSFEPIDEEGCHEYAGNPCGFLINMDDKWLYHAGDTGLFADMALLGTRHPIEVAMLPIGDNFVMGIEDAVYATNLLRPKKVIPMHYNTFPLINQDPEEFCDLVRRDVPTSEGVILKPGETLKLD